MPVNADSIISPRTLGDQRADRKLPNACPMVVKIGLFLLVVCLAAILASHALAAEVSVGEAVTTASDLEVADSAVEVPTAAVFGHNLFQGRFTAKSQPHYNPDYRVAVGDTINLRIWGSLELEMDATVDNQGNIFIPKVGTVAVGGVTNRRLVEIIKAKVHQNYNMRVFVYANVASFQPVWVFVTGNVNQPGLYQGMASDSVLQFIDKAQGINRNYGSFRDISIVRNNQPIKNIDLYDFLTAGEMDLFQFHDGDSVLVGDIQHRVTVTGDVKRPFRFEIAKSVVEVEEILALALPNPTATNLTLTRWLPDNNKVLRTYALDQSEGLLVLSGDTIEVYADHNANAITATISGEHDGRHTLLLPNGTTLAELKSQLTLTELSNIDAIQLFRKSVAERQKQLLLAKLRELETLVLTTPSVTTDEARMRSQETESILRFIDRAKLVEPKGHVVIHDTAAMQEIYLEDGDQVFIPRRTNVVLVQGEVSFPGAHTYSEGKTVRDYISLAGDFSERANKDRVLVIKQNGSVVRVESKSQLGRVAVERGDSILVFPELKGKTLQIAKDITQILYQIAVSVGILVAIF